MRDIVRNYEALTYLHKLEILEAGTITTLWESTPGATGGVYHQHSERSDIILSDNSAPTTYHAEYYSAKPGTFNKAEPWKTRLDWSNPPTYQRHERYVNTGQYGFGSSLSGHAAGMNINLNDHWTLRSARASVLSSLVASDVNVGQFLGELNQNVRMMLNASIAVLRAYRSARNGNWNLVAKHLGLPGNHTPDILPKSIADGWFAYSFGWKPMIEDIYNMKSAIDAQLNRPDINKITRSVTTSEAIDDSLAPLKGEIEIIAKVGVQYRVKSPTLAGLNALGLINPLSIAWEILPMSFVVDWFAPIGSYLKQMSAPLGLSFEHGYETKVVKVNGEMFIDYFSGDEELSATTPATVKSMWFTRTKIGTFPGPELVINTDINSQQVATFFGLLSQRI